MYNWDFASNSPADKFPAVIGDVNTPWTLDRAARREFDYPAPIVDHEEAAIRFRSFRESTAG